MIKPRQNCAGCAGYLDTPAHPSCTPLGRMDAGFFNSVQGVQDFSSRACIKFKAPPHEAIHTNSRAHVINTYTPCTVVKNVEGMRPNGVQDGCAGRAQSPAQPCTTRFFKATS
jgi:hypothetical protein